VSALPLPAIQRAGRIAQNAWPLPWVIQSERFYARCLCLQMSWRSQASRLRLASRPAVVSMLFVRQNARAFGDLVVVWSVVTDTRQFRADPGWARHFLSMVPRFASPAASLRFPCRDGTPD
jgi:hypothetical protein